MDKDLYLNVPVGTKVKFNSTLPPSLKHNEGCEGIVVWGIKDKLVIGEVSSCLNVKFINSYGNECELYANAMHWGKSIEKYFYYK
jgi:hypothetical protein